MESKINELAKELVNNLDELARNYGDYDYGLPVMSKMDDMVSVVLQAMQTYHDEGCVEFAEWMKHKYRRDFETLSWVRMKDIAKDPIQYTTTELLKLWKDEKGIV